MMGSIMAFWTSGKASQMVVGVMTATGGSGVEADGVEEDVTGSTST